MRKRHKVAIGAFTTITIIFMVVTGVVLNGIIIKQNTENKLLQNEIEKLKLETEGKINELAVSLINTNTKISNEITTINEDLSTTNKKLGELTVDTKGDFSEIITQSLPSVTIIRTLTGQGSGFFINNEGYIATNLHTLKTPAQEISNIIQVITSDGKSHSAKLINSIENLDLALIKIDSSYPELTLGNSDNVEIGEQVIAIGTPEGLAFSVTDGIVSGTQRVGINEEAYYIQTNTELNQGNSGGPLINKKGEVIGMNNFKLVDAEGLGFALESNYIKEGINKISIESLNQTLI